MKSVDCPSQLILISLPSFVAIEDMKMVAIDSLENKQKKKGVFDARLYFLLKQHNSPDERHCKIWTPSALVWISAQLLVGDSTRLAAPLCSP